MYLLSPFQRSSTYTLKLHLINNYHSPVFFSSPSKESNTYFSCKPPSISLPSLSHLNTSSPFPANVKLATLHSHHLSHHTTISTPPSPPLLSCPHRHLLPNHTSLATFSVPWKTWASCIHNLSPRFKDDLKHSLSDVTRLNTVLTQNDS